MRGGLSEQYRSMSPHPLLEESSSVLRLTHNVNALIRYQILRTVGF